MSRHRQAGLDRRHAKSGPSRRIAEWQRTRREPPPPELVATVAQGLALKEGKRLVYDEDGQLAPNQMGIFQYMRDRLDDGFVKLNDRMKLLGLLVGNAFTYATVAHEVQAFLSTARPAA